MSENIVVWDRFRGLLLDYIYDNKITGLGTEWYRKIVESENINIMPADLKKVALKFLTQYLKEYPNDKDAPCISVKNNE